MVLSEAMRSLLKSYLLEKKIIVETYLKDTNCRKKFITDEDIKEVMSWSNEIVIKILTKLGTSTHDYDICPWCIINEIILTKWTSSFKCCDCEYGKRHGQCGNSNSIYRIITEGGCGVYSIKNIHETVRKFRTEADRLLKIMYDKIEDIEV